MNTIRKNLEAIIRKGYQPYKVYEDWIGLMFHAFQRDDAHYLEIMRQSRNDASHGQREADYFAAATADALEYMAETNRECLGPLFEEFAASHYQGQFFTPWSVCRMIAKTTHDEGVKPDGQISICDPASGAGTMMIAFAKEQTCAEANRTLYVGIDVNLTCARMTALNLMFFNLNGVSIWGNSLSLEVRSAWQTHRSLAWGGALSPYPVEKAKRLLGLVPHETSTAQPRAILPPAPPPDANLPDGAPITGTQPPARAKPSQLSLFSM